MAEIVHVFVCILLLCRKNCIYKFSKRKADRFLVVFEKLPSLMRIACYIRYSIPIIICLYYVLNGLTRKPCVFFVKRYSHVIITTSRYQPIPKKTR